MEELSDFLTNKWFTSLNQALLWQKSKYQMFAPPVLWILCVHQSSLQTLKAITWQILCLLKLWANSAHLGSLFFIGKICVLLITFLDFLGMLLTPVDPADRTKSEQMQNHHSSFSFIQTLRQQRISWKQPPLYNFYMSKEYLGMLS